MNKRRKYDEILLCFSYIVLFTTFTIISIHTYICTVSFIVHVQAHMSRFASISHIAWRCCTRKKRQRFPPATTLRTCGDQPIQCWTRTLHSWKNYYYLWDMMGCASVESMSKQFNIFFLVSIFIKTSLPNVIFVVGGEKNMYVIITWHWMKMVTRDGHVCEWVWACVQRSKQATC